MSVPKRKRNPRVSTYLTPAEYRRFEARRKKKSYDASQIVREAVLQYLKGCDSGNVPTDLEDRFNRGALDHIVTQGIYLFQNAPWNLIRRQLEDPLAEHFDAFLISSQLGQIQAGLRALTLLVAELKALLDRKVVRSAPAVTGDGSRVDLSQEGLS